MNQLHVFYDAQCSFCLRCRAWLARQPAFLPLDFIPLQAPELAARFQGIQAFLGPNRLVVVGDDGAVYEGPDAFIMCLYALREFREWSLRLASPTIRPLAMGFFNLVSSRRQTVSKWLEKLGDPQLQAVLRAAAQPACVTNAGNCPGTKPPATRIQHV